MVIDTEAWSAQYREKAVDRVQKRLLIANYLGTEQEKDLAEAPNCKGFGRIRHFRRGTGALWPVNPLPIDPACETLGLPPVELLRAQVFQNAVCNWRCWYCFVPFDMLSANRAHSDWLSPTDLVDLYLDQPDPPPVIDLTGGQPDLTPEWVPWMMAELRDRGLARKVYLWSDDNLSNDYFWRYLSEGEREVVASYPSYDRVCCFKGFNTESFTFNTLAAPALFDRQFQLFSRFLTLGIDLYAYVTLTTPSQRFIEDDIKRFVDRLQMLDFHLPLRTVPLEIHVFTPVKSRLDAVKLDALKYQEMAVEVWQRELETRFSHYERSLKITEVPLGWRRHERVD